MRQLELAIAPALGARRWVFRVPMRPHGKGRPQFDGRTGRAITPKATREWERDFAAYALRFAPLMPIEGPVRVDVVAVLPRPQRLHRATDPDGPTWAPVVPDADNVRKAVLDAMARWWTDDRLVVAGETLKVYAPKGGKPCVLVRVVELRTEPDLTGLLEETDDC